MKNLLIVLRATEIQGVIQDLIYASKVSTKTPDPRIEHEINFGATKII